MITAIVLAVFSGWSMWEAAKLPVTWVRGQGPGGGFFPFWIGLLMLICCGFIFLRALRRTTPESQTDEPYFTDHGRKQFYQLAGSLFIAILMISYLGTYASIIFLLLFFMQWVGKGKHSWLATIILCIAMPLGTFIFFEIILQIVLPKGWTDPLFYPLFDFFSGWR